MNAVETLLPILLVGSMLASPASASPPAPDATTLFGVQQCLPEGVLSAPNGVSFFTYRCKSGILLAFTKEWDQSQKLALNCTDTGYRRPDPKTFEPSAVGECQDGILVLIPMSLMEERAGQEL